MARKRVFLEVTSILRQSSSYLRGTKTNTKAPMIILFLVMVFSTTVYGFASPLGEDDSFEVLLQEAVAVMVEHHPSLISQRVLVAGSEQIQIPNTRFPLSLSLSTDLGTRVVDNEVRFVPIVGMSVSLPLVQPHQKLEQATAERTLEREVERDTQALQTIQEQLTSDLIMAIEKLMQLQHRHSGRESLGLLLGERRLQQQELVIAGVAPADSLWSLDERIADIHVEIADLRVQSRLLVNQTAYNFGGSAWLELKSILEELLRFREVIE